MRRWLGWLEYMKPSIIYSISRQNCFGLSYFVLLWCDEPSNYLFTHQNEQISGVYLITSRCCCRFKLNRFATRFFPPCDISQVLMVAGLILNMRFISFGRYRKAFALPSTLVPFAKC
jgi:hypothetical protein